MSTKQKMRPIVVGGLPQPTVYANHRRSADSEYATAEEANATFEDLRSVFLEFQDKYSGSVADLKTQLAAIESDLRDQNTRNVASLAFGDIGGRFGDTDEAKERGQFLSYLRNPLRAALSTDSNPDGGYVVPSSVSRDIYKVASDQGVIRKLANVVTLEEGTSYIKVVNLGGTDSGWVTERGSRSEKAGFKLAELEYPLHEIYAMPKVTQRLLDDSNFDVAGMVTEDIGKEFGDKESVAFVSGDGVGKPRGFLEYSIVADASWARGKIGYIASGVAAALNDSSNNGADKLIDITHSLKNEYRANACWVMNKTTAATVRKLKNPTSDDYLWESSVQAGDPALLAGFPVYLDPNMPDIGAGKYPIAFGDFKRAYTIVDRIGISVVPDKYTQKGYVLFYSTKRVGGGVSDFGAVKLLKIAAS